MIKNIIFSGLILTSIIQPIYPQERVITEKGNVVILNPDGFWVSYTSPKQDVSSKEKLEGLELSTSVRDFFSGLFQSVGIEIIDTDEEFTIRQKDGNFIYSNGILREEVDFTVEIYTFQVDRLSSFIQAGELSEVEKFRVLKAFYHPVTMAGLTQPEAKKFMTSRFFSWFIDRKRITHVTLVSPDHEKEPSASYSLLFINKQWLLVPGLYGLPERVFKVKVDQSLDMNRHMVRAMEVNRFWEWVKLANWYKKWRQEVGV